MLSLLWPRPTRLVLAGRVVSAMPLRLVDLAGLEHWAAQRAGSTSAGLWAAVQIPDAPARRAELRRLYERGERGGVTFGDPDVSAWLATADGRAEQLRLSLRVRDRQTGRIRRPRRRDCLDMATDADLDDWAAWAAVAWQVHPCDEVARAIDAEIGAVWPTPRPRPAGADSGERGWEAAVWAVCKAAGWTFDDVGKLTLYRWDIARSDGSPRKVSAVEPEQVPDGIDPRDFDRDVMARRAAFWDAAAEGDASA